MTRARRWGVAAKATLVLLAVAIVAPTAGAATMPSQTSVGQAAQVTQTDAAAERQLVQAALVDLTLSEKQAAERVQLLTDQEVQVLAGDLDSIRAGGAGGSQTFSLEQVLLIAILVLLIAD